MSLVVAIDEIKPDQVKRTDNPNSRTPVRTNVEFFRASRETPDSPSAYISRWDPGQKVAPHYHAIDQFQIIIEGKGTFGRHNVSPYCVHFNRAHTPYGPLQSDKEIGWAWLGLRARYDPSGSKKVPAAQEELKQIPDRRPWQIVKRITFPAPGPGVSLQDIPEIKDDQGLFVHALTMAPYTRITAPDPSSGDGQFVVLFKGSLVHDNKERKAMAVAFVKPEETAFQIHAGAQGLEGLILNLPQVKTRTAEPRVTSTAAGFKKWQCLLCSFAYDEAIGMPEEGIPAGTRWEDVPNSWSCPDCSATKSEFQMVPV